MKEGRKYRAGNDLTQGSVCVTFDDNTLLKSLFGEHDKHIDRIEKLLDVVIQSRGSMICVSGTLEHIACTRQVLQTLYHKLNQGMQINVNDVEAAVRMSRSQHEDDKAKEEKTEKLLDNEIVIKTTKKHVTPYSHKQKEYIKALYDKEMVFSCGPAGTGKTYLAVAVAVSMFLSHKVERLILSRPAIEAGEKIGFLPGDMKDKVDPYMQPIYDALYDMLPAEKVAKYIEQRVIEIAPLAFMRGRTLRNAFVILDEAQNATATQMKMFLTRLGEGSRMVIAGDLSQIDLPRGVSSGLSDALSRLHSISDIGKIYFDDTDVVRHELVAKIVSAYSNSMDN